MKSTKPGKTTSVVEVTNISAHGFWIFVDNCEYFVDFDLHHWFKDATVRQILNVTFHHGHHLRWPDLDVDLELDSLIHPEKYPLIYKSAPKSTRASA